MKFKSKQDWWLTVIVWGSMLVLLGGGVIRIVTKHLGIGEWLVVFSLAILLPIFVLWMWLTTYYVLDDRHLIIRYGPFKKVIPLNEIRSIKKTRNHLSSPALSLDRLEILYNKYDSVLISPKDREGFMKILAKHCLQINPDIDN